MATIELWVRVDENGDFGMGTDADTADEQYGENVGSLDGLSSRLVCVKLEVELPTALELTGEAPMLGEGGKLVAVG